MSEISGRQLGLWRKLTIGVVALGLIAGLGVTQPSAAEAVAATDFRPGNIISDELFYDGRALSASEVQSFLNTRVPRCTIGDPGKAPGSPIYGSTVAKDCMKSFKMSTQSRASNQHCSAYVGSNSESAAQIITKVGQACGISQKVLLVMLEKEQSLVQDTWPTERQLSVAMGYACPDSGPNGSANCNSNYFGFQNQVYWAAWQLKVYKANPNSFNYKPYQVNAIKWSPDNDSRVPVDCGTSQVYIENWATAALYIYTPYRPNQAALNAGWGAGDVCSSYGNRNFFMFFATWFGLEQAPLGTPYGEVKELWTTNNRIHMWGWAVDLDEKQSPVQIHVRYGSSWAATTANAHNTTAEVLYPGSGPNHGFGMSFAAPPGAQKVCVWAKNIGRGADRLLTCEDLNVPDGSPVGRIGDMWSSPGMISMWGWALDPDDVGPIDMHISINGRWAVMKADAQNLSTAASYPDHGTNHGFGGRIAADPGDNKVCVYAINKGAGSNTNLGCRVINVPTGNPVGEVKEIWGVPGGFSMWGWALDPDTIEPIELHVSINGRWAKVQANAQNLSTQAKYPGHGTNHGFGARIAADPGANRVCVYAINKGPGTNSTLLCKTVVVPDSNPQGEVKELWGTPGSINMWGWAADPDTTEPIDLHVRVDGTQWFVVRADSPYSAMPQLMPNVGLNHGFGAKLPATTGAHEVCVFAVNVGPGANRTLRCSTVTT